MISRTSAAVTLALALATPLAAQNAPTYRRVAGETLRYHEVTEDKSEMNNPSGKGGSATENRRETTVVIAFGAGDTAQAWFEAFNATMKTPQGDMTAPTEGLLKKPFPLVFAADGAIQVPSGPQPARTVFARFFLKLPARPLAAGAEWADTMGGKRETPDGARAESKYIVKYKVTGDTALGGLKALAIALKGEGTSRITGKGQGGSSTQTRTRTTANGRILFSVELGRMLSSETTVERTGRMVVRGDEGVSRGPAHPTGRVDVGTAPETRGTETHARTHTLIELLPSEQMKAAPTN